MIRLTGTGLLFLGVLVLLYLASLTSQSGLLLLLIGILGGCYVVNAAGAWRSVRRVEIHPPPTTRICEGQKLTQPWRVINPGKTAAGLLQVASNEGRLLRIATLPAETEIQLVPDLIYWRRGVYAYSGVHLSSVFPFGLIQATRRLALPGVVVVHPALYPALAARAGGYDVMLGGKFHGRRRTNAGANFAGVRPIQPGDSLKQVHWKSSAKGLGLMVKTFDEELSGRVAVMIGSGPAASSQTLDHCVRAAGSLIFASLDAGHHVEWIDTAQGERWLIPPFDDGQEVLDRLARIQPGPKPLTADMLHAALEQFSRRSAIHLVLTSANAVVWDAVELLICHGRSVSVYLPEHAGLPEAQTGVPVFTYDEHEIRLRT